MQCTDNEPPRDLNFMRYVGWTENYCARLFFSDDTVSLISKKVTELTRGVDPKNRKIIIPKERITEAMDAVYSSFVPSVGDIHSRYVVPSIAPENQMQNMIDQTIEIIVSHVRNELEMAQNNQKLSAWVQVYGDFNVHNLRAHDIIKIQEKRPATMQFNMNY